MASGLIDMAVGSDCQPAVSKQFASRHLAAVLRRVQQRQQVAAFEALRWHSLAAQPSSKLARTSAAKAAPLAQRCKQASKELRAQLALCKEAFNASGDAAERALLGRRLQSRASKDERLPEHSPVTTGAGVSASSSASAPKSGAHAASDDHMAPATVWHPPGNEDEAMWKELGLLVEGLGEANPKWAGCIARVIKRLETSHTTCRKQRDDLLSKTRTSMPPTSSSEETKVPESRSKGFPPDDIIFPGYGKTASPHAAPSSAVATPSGSGVIDDRGATFSHDRLRGLSEATQASSKADTLAAEAALQKKAEARTALSFGPAVRSLPAESMAGPSTPLSVGPPQRSPRQQAPPTATCSPQPPSVPSVQISLLAERGEAAPPQSNGVAVEAADGRAPSPSTSSSEGSDGELTTIQRGAWTSKPASVPSVPVLQALAVDQGTERQAPERSSRLGPDSMLTPQKAAVGGVANYAAAQNGFEATPTASVPVSGGSTLLQSASANLKSSSSGVMWPPTMLYTPRAHGAPLQRSPLVGEDTGRPADSSPFLLRGDSAQSGQVGRGDKNDALLDNLSRSATSLFGANAYTPRQKPTARLGIAAAKGQRTGSLRYPPNNTMARTFGVQRMASGHLTQATLPPQNHQVATSPKHLPASAAAGGATGSKRVPARSPSVSTSPKRTTGHGQSQTVQVPPQWAGARPASAVAPTAAQSANTGPRLAPHGVSRQSSCELSSSLVTAQSLGLPNPAMDTMHGNYAMSASAATVAENTRRTTSIAGTGSAAGSATGPLGGSHSSARGGPPPTATVSSLSQNGYAASKGAPPPMTSVPVGAKGYSSIQLWTPRSPQQSGADPKKAAVVREPRELSVEPPIVGRSPSASLSLSPRHYPSLGVHPGAVPVGMMPKLAARRA